MDLGSGKMKNNKVVNIMINGYEVTISRQKGKKTYCPTETSMLRLVTLINSEHRNLTCNWYG